MIKQRSISQKISLYVATLVLFGVLLMSVISYFEASERLREEINRNVTIKVEYLNEKVSGFFEKREVLLDTEAAVAEKNLTENRDKILERLEQQHNYLQKEYGIVDIYVGFADGTIETGTGWQQKDRNWKSNDRPWYLEAEKKQGKIAYTEVYTDVHTGTPVVTMSKMIYGKEKQAVIAIDISLIQLIKLLENEKLGENGYPFILDQDGRFIVHPQYTFHEDINTADTIFNINSGNLKELGSNLLSNEMEMFRAAYQGNQKVYLSKKLGYTDFYLIVGIDQKEMRIQLNIILTYNIFISAIAVMSFLLVWLLIRKKEQEKQPSRG